jgi:hypothetical protein
MKNTTHDSAAAEPAEHKSTSAPAETSVPVDSPAPSSRRSFRTPVIVGAAAGALVVGAALGGVGGYAIGNVGGVASAGSHSQFPGGGPGGGMGGPPGQGTTNQTH